MGNFLCVGDKTTCGGAILSGTSDLTFYGRCAARAGDEVSCGRFPGIFKIIDGTPSVFDLGLLLAGSMDSYSSCPCQSRFIPSIPDEYANEPSGQRRPPSTFSSMSLGFPTEPEQYAQSTKKLHSPDNGTTAPYVSEQQSEEEPQPEQKEIILTIGVFFDGTGNNVENTLGRLQNCSAKENGLDDSDAMSCQANQYGKSGDSSRSSYDGYYTNIHWLNSLYQTDDPVMGNEYQQAIYVEGIGTKNGQPDNTIGLGLGVSDTGVIAKTNEAIPLIQSKIENFLKQRSNVQYVVKKLQFDIMGFSRGAAASRHFANRVYEQDPALIQAIKAGMGPTQYQGKPAGETRFLGLFDTVAAIGTLADGLNPHDSNNADVKLQLPVGIAQHVFQISAMHECRYNFSLNSVNPAYPELILPGVHSDIGGGYNPLETEYIFLTRPVFETVLMDTPLNKTRVYQQASQELTRLSRYSNIAPMMAHMQKRVLLWADERAPQHPQRGMQKRAAAAGTGKRVVTNDWSKVCLRVMIDAAKDAHIVFNSMDETEPDMALPSEINLLCEKAIIQGRAIRSGMAVSVFTSDEIVLIAKYNHCSANWNSVVMNDSGAVTGAVQPSELIGFVNRPNTNWIRTVFDLYGRNV